MPSTSGFPCDPVERNLAVNAGDAGDMSLTPRSGRFPGGGNGNPLQYFCLGNVKDRGAWWATTHTVIKSWASLSD